MNFKLWIIILLGALAPFPGYPRSVQLTHGNAELSLPLPEKSQLEFRPNGGLYAKRSADSTSAQLLSIRPRATRGEAAVVLQERGLRIGLRNEPEVRVRLGNGSELKYQFDSITAALAGEITADNWTLADNVLLLNLHDPSALDAAVIHQGLATSRSELEQLQQFVALSEDPAAVLQLPETRKSLFQLERLIESGLSEDRYAPAREYLRMNVKSIAKSIDNGDFQQAETQFRVFSLQMASADRMLSFDVSSEPTRVKIQLYASLDVAPRHEYYTDQRIHAVVPGSYRLLASKHGYADAAIPNLDLFSIRPSLITCEMSATPGSPSVCRIEVQP